MRFLNFKIQMELKIQLNTPSKDDMKRIDEIWESKRDDYAIFDSIVCKKLKAFNKQYKFAEFSDDDFKLENYPKYVEILDKFRKRFTLNCTFRELDLYLWKMGKLEKLENSK